jgi:WD40 repeat protein
MSVFPATPLPAPSPAHSVWATEAPVVAAAWLGDTAAAALGDGTLRLLRPGLDKPLAVPLTQGGALLSLAATPRGFAAGADDGTLALVSPQGEPLWHERLKSPFLEHLAYEPATKTLAVATGRTVALYGLDGALRHTLEGHPSTVLGLAASPLAPRLAVAHHNGVTIHNLQNPKQPPRVLAWKGVHQALTYSPDGKWLISAMQEQAIHLWRLGDGLDLQMRGYPGKIKQFSWRHDGLELATDGGHGLVLWPFPKNKPDGPAGQSARSLAESDPGSEAGAGTLVTAVAMHPKGPFAALGYGDGLILLTNTQTRQSLLLKAPDSQGPTTTLAWNTNGLHLLAGTQAGWLALIDFSRLAQ